MGRRSDPAASDRIIGLYEDNAEAWAELRSGAGALEAPWLERFAGMLPPGACVLDLGCGSGEPVADWLMGRGFAVTGVDSSPSLIGRCRARHPDQQWLA